MVKKTYCDGEWTHAKFTTFVKSQLRAGSMKWPPKNKVMQQARRERGVYFCSGCNQNVPYTKKEEGKSGRTKNVFVDHISPIVDPHTGFTTWDDFINKLYCDSSNLQVLCKDCHDKKSAEERRISNARTKKEKYNE